MRKQVMLLVNDLNYLTSHNIFKLDEPRLDLSAPQLDGRAVCLMRDHLDLVFRDGADDWQFCAQTRQQLQVDILLVGRRFYGAHAVTVVNLNLNMIGVSSTILTHDEKFT